MGQDDVVDIVFDFKANQASLSELRSEMFGLMSRISKLGKSDAKDTIISKLTNDTMKLSKDIGGLELELEKVSDSSIELNFEKTLDSILEVQTRLEEIADFRDAAPLENSNLTQQIEAAKLKLEELNSQLIIAKENYENLKASSADSAGLSEKKYNKELAARKQIVSSINLQIDSEKNLISQSQEAININNARVESERLEEAELQNRLLTLQGESDELYRILQSNSELQQAEQERVTTQDEIKNRIIEQTSELRKQLSATIQLVQEEEKRQNSQAGSGNEQRALSKEEESSLKNRRSYIKAMTAQYYYQLRALKMLNYSIGSIDKTTSKWGKTLISASAKVLKTFGKLSLGFLGLRKNMDKATSSSKSFGASLAHNLWTMLRYIFGIRSLYSLFSKLRHALSDGMENLATAFTHVNKQMSSVVGSMTQMKNATATLVQPLLNVLAPALEKLAALFSQLAVAIASFFAAFTGQKFVYKAAKATGSYIDAQKGAKKATDDTNKSIKQQLAQFDKLNLLTTDKDKDKDGGGGGGVGDMFDTVPLEKKWEDLANKIKRILKDLFYPIKIAWMEEGQFVIDSWKYGLNECWKLIKDIGRDFLIMWQQNATVNMWKDIFHIVGDIGLIIGNLAKNLRDAWNTNQIGLRIFESIRDIIAMIIHGIREAADYTVKWSATLNFYPLLKSFYDLLEKIKPLVQTLVDLGVYFYEHVMLKFQKFILERGLPNLLDTLGKIIDKIDRAKLSERMKKLMDAFEPFMEKVFKSLVIVIEDLGNALADFINSKAFGDFIDKLVEWMKKADPNKMAKGIERLVKAFLEFKAAIKIAKGVTGALVGLKTIFNFLLQARLRKELSLINTALTNMGVTATAQVSGWSKLNTSFVTFTGSLQTGAKRFADMILNIGKGKVSLQQFNTALGSGTQLIRNFLGPIGSLAAGIVGVIAQFKLMSSGVKELREGSENMGASVLKVIAGIAAGCAGLLVFLGPQGLIVAGVVAIVTAIVAAMKGFDDAYEEIKDAAIGESIATALSDNGGTPLEDRLQTLTEQMHNFASSFTEISSKSADLELARTHIRDVYTEIDLIRQRMDNGVISVEEGTTRMSELFGELKTNTAESFDALDKVLLSAFGEGSPIRKIYEMLGYDVSGLTDAIVSSNGTIQNELSNLYDEAESIMKEMGELDPTNPHYQELNDQLDTVMTQIQKLDGTFSESNEAMIKYSSYLDTHRLDFKGFINLEDGSVDIDKLKGMFTDLKTATDEGKVEAVSALNKAKSDLESEIKALETVASMRELTAEEQTNLNSMKQALSFIPQAIEETNRQFDEAAGTLTSDIQTYMIKSIPAVMEEASNNWESEASKHWFPKMWKAMHPKEEWVAEAVDKYTESIGQVSDAVQSEFGNMGDKATGWGRGVTEKALNGMVSDEVTHGEMWSTSKRMLTESWQEAYQTAADETDIYRIGSSMSTNFITGSAEAMEGAQSTLSPAMKNVTDTYEDTANTVEITTGRVETANTNMTNSMSSVGDYAMPAMVPVEDSYGNAATAVENAKSSISTSNKGIVTSTTTATTDVSSQMDIMVNKANTTATEMTAAGDDTGKGWQQALINNLSEAIRNAQLKFENWVKDVKSFFGISSPSKLFADIGKNIILGLSGGINDTWNIELPNILGIFSDFVSDAEIELDADKFKEFGKNIIEGLRGGLEKAWEDAKTRVNNIWNGVSESARKAFDIGSPSKVFKKIGGFIVDGLQIGLEDNDIENSFVDMASDLSKNTLDIFEALVDNIEGIMSRIELLADLDNISSQLSNISNVKVPDIAVGYRLPENVEFAHGNSKAVAEIKKILAENQSEELQLLREQNALLMGILNKEFGISSKQIFDATRNENNRFIKQHGRSAFEY